MGQVGTGGQGPSTRAQRRHVQDEQRALKAARAMGPHAAELVLVRHGETAYNREQRLQGQELPGPPLNELGRQQATVVRLLLRPLEYAQDPGISGENGCSEGLCIAREGKTAAGGAGLGCSARHSALRAVQTHGGGGARARALCGQRLVVLAPCGGGWWAWQPPRAGPCPHSPGPGGCVPGYHQGARDGPAADAASAGRGRLPWVPDGYLDGPQGLGALPAMHRPKPQT
jgi:hypothetical protein